MEDAKAFTERLNGIDKKLDAQGNTLDAIRDRLYLIAEQKVQIANIQAMQQEHHVEIGELQNRIATITNWQAGCPRGQIATLWGVILAIAGSFGMIFLYHILSGVKHG